MTKGQAEIYGCIKWARTRSISNAGKQRTFVPLSVLVVKIASCPTTKDAKRHRKEFKNFQIDDAKWRLPF